VDDIFAIQMLKAAYFRAIDTKDWDLLGSVMTEDVEIDVTDDLEDGRPSVGRAPFVETCSRVLSGAVTVHHGHMPEIHVTGDTATGIWAMEDFVDWGSGEDGAARAFRGYGHYHERYVKDADGAWRIAALTLTRLRRDWL
jgi:ketosteroid isomerase-like protein